MSFIGSMFSNANGSGFKGQNAFTQNPVTAAQEQGAQDIGAQSVQGQQALAQALQGLGGIQNLSSAYGQNQALANQLAAQNGAGNQSSVFNQQQALANQLGGMAQGNGPNPALAQLAQTTGANTANQAALMAGQRGTGANAGLLAREAAQQGAANQQNAAGQAATLRAQQQLAAINALQNQQAAMGNLAGTQVGQQLGATGNLANIAAGETGLQQAGVNAATQAAQNQQQMVQNALNQQNANQIAQQSNINNVNAGIAQGNQKAQQQGFFGAMSALPVVGQMGGSGGGSSTAMAGGQGEGLTSMMGPATMLAANGGMVPQYASGGAVSGPSSNVGKHLKGSATYMAQGGMAKQPVVGEMLAAQGKLVPGQAKVSGDSLKNDIVDAKLSPGEIVIPRSVAQGANPVKDSAKFVAAILAKNGKRK